MTTDEKPWDLVVIGAGSAGLTAARTARLLGARVLLIERHRWGGDCLWTGCVPSKTLIAQARERRRSQSPSAAHGGAADIDAAIDQAREHIAPGDSPEALEKIGVTTLHGEAVFSGPQSMTVDGRPLAFTHVIVATGSRPSLPEIPGIDAVDPLTSDTIWDLRSLPDRLLVLGGGAIGCELAQALARLGVQVTMVHRGPDILPSELPSARSVVRQSLEADGIGIHTGRSVAVFQPDADGNCAAILDNSAQVDFDRVLVATGRVPNVDGLGLAAANVDQDDGGWVTSDSTLRTTNPSIWAAGDVTWLPKHTHMAGSGGAVAARNALLGTRQPIHGAGSPRVLFTSPEIGSVGQQHPKKGGDRVVTVNHEHLDRAVVDGDTAGFTRIVVDRRGRIVGGTIVGPRAGETLGELALAVNRGVTVDQLMSVVHPYPSYSDGLWNAAIMEAQRRIRDGPTGRVAGVMRRLNLARARRAQRFTEET